MLARINKAMAKKDSGFTLIELLVVVIIIGILAAIAIPTFLNQREAGWRAQATSNLRNGVTNVETFAVNNNGTYADIGTAAGVTALNNGIAPLKAGSTTASLTVGATPAASASQFCVQVIHPAFGTAATGTFRYTKSLDLIENKACGAA